MLTITAQEIVKFTASARPNLNHFKFTKSHIVVILQTLQEGSATVKGTKGGEGEESTEWEWRIKEYLMMTVHMRTEEQKHPAWCGMWMSLFTDYFRLFTLMIFYLYVMHTSERTIYYIVALKLLFCRRHLLCLPLDAALKAADEPLCNSVQFHEIWRYWTQWEFVVFERRQRLIFFYGLDPHMS